MTERLGQPGAQLGRVDGEAHLEGVERLLQGGQRRDELGGGQRSGHLAGEGVRVASGLQASTDQAGNLLRCKRGVSERRSSGGHKAAC